MRCYLRKLESIAYNYNKMLKRRGTEGDPIDLEEQLEEERDVTNQMKEEARNRAIIEQAKITGSRHEICLAVAKTMVPGTKETKNRRIGKVVIKHFLDALNIKIQCDNFKRRRQPDYSLQSTEPNPCEFVLYGVDFLSTKMIVDRFKLAESELERVVWVDDSNCKLIFNDEQSARKMLESQLKYPDTLKSKIEEDVDALPRCWFLLKPYEVYTYERNLYLRYATTLEANMEKDISNNYDQYVQVQEKLYPKLLEQFGAKDKYLSIIEEIENEKGSSKRFVERSRSRNDRKSQFQDEQGFYRRRNNQNGDRLNRSKNFGRPGSFHVRQIAKARYEHHPATSRRVPNSFHHGMSFRMENSVRENNPNQNLSFVYFDPEEQNNHANLSFEMRNSLNLSHLDYDRKMKDVQNLDCSLRNKSILAQEGLQNLSVIYADKSKANIDPNMSINIVEKPHNNSANDLDLNYSIFQSKDQQQKPKDLNELAEFFEVSELSPIEQEKPLDCSFPVAQKSIINPKPIPADFQFNNYRKPEKKKQEIDVLSDYSY